MWCSKIWKQCKTYTRTIGFLCALSLLLPSPFPRTILLSEVLTLLWWFRVIIWILVIVACSYRKWGVSGSLALPWMTPDYWLKWSIHMSPPDSELKDQDYIFFISFPRAHHKTTRSRCSFIFCSWNQISYLKMEVAGKDWTLCSEVSGASILLSYNGFWQICFVGAMFTLGLSMAATWSEPRCPFPDTAAISKCTARLSTWL